MNEEQNWGETTKRILSQFFFLQKETDGQTDRQTDRMGEMNLYLDNQPLQSVELDSVICDARIVEMSSQFRSKGMKTIPIDASAKSVYVYQREWASVDCENDANVKYLGSQDATTCIIVLLRGKKAANQSLTNFCVHLDGEDGQEEALKHAIEEIFLGSDHEQQGVVEVETHLVGGFNDDDGKNLSREHCQRVLRALATEIGNGNIRFMLRTCCIEKLNTAVKHVSYTRFFLDEDDPDGTLSTEIVTKDVKAPVVTGAAMDIETGEVFPSYMVDQGPASPLRSLCSFMSNERLINTYDSARDRFVIQPVAYRNFPADVCKQLIMLPDSVLLENTSTSPLVESEEFPSRMRETLLFMLKHPNADKDVFKDGPLVYRRATQQEQEQGNDDNTQIIWIMDTTELRT